MNVSIRKNPEKLKRFWVYVLNEILKSYSLEEGEIMDFSIDENSGYFPDFVKKPVIMRVLNIGKRYESNGKGYRNVNAVTPLQQEIEQNRDKQNIRDGKEHAIFLYIIDRLKESCLFRGAEFTEDGPINGIFSFKIIHPEKIYAEAKKLGIQFKNDGSIKTATHGTEHRKKVTVLYINEKGELWRDPKVDYCYSILKGSDRHKIVEYFARLEIYNYYPTQQIADEIKNGNVKSLGKEIAAINEMTKEKVLIRCDLLQNEWPVGYRINPRISLLIQR